MSKKFRQRFISFMIIAAVLFLGFWNTTEENLKAQIPDTGSQTHAVSLHPLTNIVDIGNGGGHTCVRTDTGGMKCWGYNADGRLGDGTMLTRTTPVDVMGLTSDVMAIAVGGYHTCAITTIGKAKCWGYNGSGQLGDGTILSRTTPVNVTGLISGVTALDGGRFHSCALTNSGGLKCWGYNDQAQLGDGTTTNRFTPVEVNDFASGVIAVAVGDLHTCALMSSGGVKCWGYYDTLGGTSANRYTPVDVTGLGSGVTAITAYGNHTCALLRGGGVKCWGHNNYGKLGDGTMINRYTPVDVSGLTSGVIAISAGYDHTCALLSSGGVKCWGYNWAGQLGDGTTTNHSTPVDVIGLAPGVTAIAAGSDHTCALTSTGGVKCWGFNHYGQLGDGTTTNRSMPVDVMEEGEIPTPTFTPTATPTFVPTAPNTPTNTPIPPTATPANTPMPGSTDTPTPEPTAVTVRVTGKVLDKDTQTGIPNVLMTLTGASEAAVQASSLYSSSSSRITSGVMYTTTTALDGAFVFPAVKLGAYTLTGVKEGKVIEAPAPLVINAGGTVQVPPLQATQVNAMVYLPLVTK